MLARLLYSKLTGFLLVLAMLSLWEAASRAGLMAPNYVPSVTAVLQRFVNLVTSGILPLAFADTFKRIVQGYAYAAILGVLLGVLMGSLSAVYRTLNAAIEFVRPLPSAAIIPIVMLFLGLGDAMKIFVITWACFFPILLSTVHGVRNIDRTLVDTARTLHFSRVRTLFELVLPAASPSISTGLRLSLSLSLILGVTTELVAGENGIGFYILQAQRSFRAVDVYASVLALGIVGYLLNRAFVGLETRVLSWHHGLTLRQAAA